jgi:AraC-like DNA-binding protein
MPQSRVFAFADPDSYRIAFRAAEVNMLVKSTGAFHAELTQIDLNRLWMQRGSDSLPRIVRTQIDVKRAPILFFADEKQASMQVGGEEVSPGQIVLYRPGATTHQQTSASFRWASMSLTPEDLAAAGEAIAGRELAVRSDTQVLRPDPHAMARLRFLHDEAERLAKTAPDTLARPAIAKALEQASVRAMIACLTGDMPIDAKSCMGHHARMIARFEDFLEARRYEPVYLAEICAAVGVSERTLRTCCHEHLGMSPVRYLWLRRMHLARRALLRADPVAATVTGIATDHGFWELGRFSVEYRALFGEMPSTSLRRPPDEALGRKSWN